MILDDAAHANLVRRRRGLLLALVLFGALGLLAELVRVEHWAQDVQWAPIVILVLMAAGALLVWAYPSGGSVKAFRLLMVLGILAGVFGGLIHFRSNAVAAREADPSLQGPPLVEVALAGETPALAPGALIHLGLLGLVAVYRHSGRKPER